MTIKPIQTRYNNRLFRSRLEARWAVFFSSLNLDWEYEKEGFDLNGTYYLPDFYLPHLDLWIEIKPKLYGIDWPDHFVFKYLNENPIEKNGEITNEFNFVLLYGQPNINTDSFNKFDYEGFISTDCGYLWCECDICGFIGIEFDGRSYRLPCHRDVRAGDKGYNTDSERLLIAYQNAMEARFER